MQVPRLARINCGRLTRKEDLPWLAAAAMTWCAGDLLVFGSDAASGITLGGGK